METTVLNHEEQQLLQSVENGEWKSTENLEEVEKMLNNAIHNYRKRQKQIQLSVNSDDFYKLRRISTEKGISPENLINALIHNYTNGSISLNL